MSGALPRLHAVTDDRVVRRRDFLERAAAVATAGGDRVAIQLRCRLDGRAYTALGDAVHAAIAPFHTPLLINDRCDVARVVGAAGAHLPEDGLPTPAALGMLGRAALVGRSVHDARALAARQPAEDYLTLGPVWPTPSHPNRQALGVRRLGDGALPVIAIGGVTPERAAEARRGGAYGVAAVRAVWEAEDPGAAVAAFLLSLEA